MKSVQEPLSVNGDFMMEAALACSSISMLSLGWNNLKRK